MSGSLANQSDDPLAHSPFVGRASEFALLRDRLASACNGHGSLVCIAGEPGIGKTRIAEELVRTAEADRVVAAWGFCSAWDDAPPYWPWIQIVRTLRRAIDWPDERLRHSGTSDLGRLVDSTGMMSSSAGNPTVLQPEHARLQLFDAVASYLGQVADRQPLVLVLDDLHWADIPSLRLLDFVVSTLSSAPILILATYRDTELDRHHPLVSILTDLTRRLRNHRIRLSPLAQADTERYIQFISGQAVRPAMTAALHAETDGNPLFLTEIVRWFMADGSFDSNDDALPERTSLPETIRDVIIQRVDRLAVSTRDVLTVAAIIGLDFTWRLVQVVLDQPPDTVLAALDVAVAARIVVELDDAGSYRFTHALIQEALYREVPSAERAWMHQRVGEALEALVTDDPDPPLAALAYHFAQAARRGPVDQALTYLERAAEQARSQFAWESAADALERALALLDNGTPDDSTRRCALFLGLADARWSGGESSSARSIYAQAADLARRIRSTECFARAAIGYAGNDTVGVAVRDRQAVNWLTEALAYGEQVADALRVRLLCQLAYALFEGDDLLDRRRSLTSEALDLARRLADPILVLHALDAHWYALNGPDLLADRMAIAREELELAQSLNDDHAALLAAGGLAADQLEIGDMAAFDQATDQYRQLADRLRLPVHQFGSLLFPLCRATMSGQLSEAQAIIERAWPVGRRAIPAEVADRIIGQFLVELRREQERLTDVEPMVTRFAAGDPPSEQTYWRARLALVYLETDRIDMARQLFGRLAVHQFSDLPRDAFWLVSMAMLAEVAARLDDRDRAAALYQCLKDYPDRNVNTNLFWACHGSSSHALGLLATTLGQPDLAVQHFEDALAFDTRMQARLFVTRDQVAYAQLLAQRDGPVARQQALELARTANTTATELGLVRLRRLSQTLIDTVSIGRDRVQGASLHGLSTRELEVLQLIVEGKTDREIAETLFISHRTVMRHVTHILDKLAVPSRTAAAAVAVREGLA